jgi:phospho-N-acetylmuramoyl-pentapeptide-transferase
VAGACIGFWAYNRHPAGVFMGDTGSLALGGGMACAAMLAGLEVLMLLVGAVFLLEFGSSLLQIFSFQLTGRRVLPIAPLHHIPQKKNVPEPRIVRGFYMGGLMAAILGGLMMALAQ